ncbi:MAG: large subunit of alpha-aminoadipate reductase [Sclerophora amabilis]|nr:MAG: large subunit of alpha-aminoadipate reductase [Sclerophora amabilis]
MAAQFDPRPDPRADLCWSDFRGAIQDIFAENARRHPERVCVVETASSSSPRRDFSYKQINEASNILAHHLVQRGLQRGDVVMVYAHRGVELPVVVMGILKAGGTFSVIDPGYPPDRQIVYFDVARPKALIVIQKATLEAGRLTDKVRSYIAEHLDLKTEIPGLMLQDDGFLRGGQIDGKDALEDQIALAADTPGIVVGPDSTPTLSFTSGSEGRPKGVKGRHFSLAYYFPWMSKTFNLTQDDRFTMLSGIAHDPIQRDIFTPLFLGAQLLVPSREDIQHELLAEWMLREKATVTHLTPAMGQILVGGATTVFPSLHHAFFVGDVLIKRDCRRLQELAPNVNIINMYGTTETQRAVSYFRIPSRNQDASFLDEMGEVIPAGKGMYNVQILVVDRQDKTRLCSVGETGEIYVRAGGLAEGYLGEDLAELTRSKGHRSKPSGSLGENTTKDHEIAFIEVGIWGVTWRQATSNAQAALTIRCKFEDFGEPLTARHMLSFPSRHTFPLLGLGAELTRSRIELGEIDTYLSQHPIVRENVTLIRRDRDEEPTLVSYIVPDIKKWQIWLGEQGLTENPTDETMVGMLKRFRALRDNVRNHLKLKLPAYAVPTVLVPLSRMPLNPNGKIDKPALPFPDAADLNAAALRRPSASLAAMSPTERTVADIWASLIPHVLAKTIDPKDSFFDLGGHSILAQQMLFAVRKTWQGVDISMSTIFRHSILREFAAEIDRALDPIGLRLDSGEQSNSAAQQDEDYTADAKELAKQLPASFPSSRSEISQSTTVFLTGATGFLGAYVLRNLMDRKSPLVNVIAHIRAQTPVAGLYRIKQTCQAYGIWSDAWLSRIECVIGNLDDCQLGLQPNAWEKVANEADIVIHNGAKVHWVLPYMNLKQSNVLSTMDTLSLCASGKPKQMAFVSSTSVLDTDYYVEKSDGGTAISEDDNLEGSRKGLGTGYGQSKWVSEYIVREAGKRGLNGAIIRPGYVTGHSETGVTNTDDFLVRMLKGSIQLHSAPEISNSVNMVPVDQVASVVVASALFPPASPLGVCQVTGHPRQSFSAFVGTLGTYGYDVPMVDYYKSWRGSMEDYIVTTHQAGEGKKEEHALMPLYHLVTGDLPANTKAPELDDSNAVRALKADAKWSGETDRSAGSGVTEELMGIYLSYLITVGFLPPPPDPKTTSASSTAKPLPHVRLKDGQREALEKVGGRGGSALVSSST